MAGTIGAFQGAKFGTIQGPFDRVDSRR